MGLSQWMQAVQQNDNTNLTPNLVSKTDLEVDTTPNSFVHSWGNSNKLKINSNGTEESGVYFNFDSLEIGDMLEIECEVRVISGSSPLLKIAEYNTTTLVEAVPIKKTFVLNNEWQMIKFKTYISNFRNYNNHRAFVGLEAGQSGIFELRSVRAIAYSKVVQPQDKIDRGFYRYIVKKVSGIWTIQNGSSAGGVITNPQTWNLVLEFPRQVYPSINISSNVSNSYIFGFFPPTSTKVTMHCKKLGDETSGAVNWTSVPDDTVLYITIFYKY